MLYRKRVLFSLFMVFYRMTDVYVWYTYFRLFLVLHCRSKLKMGRLLCSKMWGHETAIEVIITWCGLKCNQWNDTFLNWKERETERKQTILLSNIHFTMLLHSSSLPVKIWRETVHLSLYDSFCHEVYCRWVCFDVCCIAVIYFCNFD